MLNEQSSRDTAGAAGAGGAYKPPSMRGPGGASQPTSMGKKMDFGGKGPLNKGLKLFIFRVNSLAETNFWVYDGLDDYTVRVSNLPEEATESDLQELFKPFGKVVRTFLAKDKTKQVSRGFAFVTFANKEDAQRAIWGVNDYGYNHLILKVEWAK